MKRLIMLLITTILAMSVIACGSEKKEEPVVQESIEKDDEKEKIELASEPVEEASADFQPVSGTVDGFKITVIGAEHFVDTEDKDAIRIFYEFENNSEESDASWSVFSLEVEQDGYEQVQTYAPWGEERNVAANDALSVRPGTTILCSDQYTMKLDGGAVIVSVFDYWGGELLFTVELDPQNLPGAPVEEWVPELVSSPQWVLDYYDEGTIDEVYNIYIDRAEVTESYDGETLIRVYYEFTNNSDEATSFWMAATPYVYQDGIELHVGYPKETNEFDENSNVDVEPGSMLVIAQSYILRTESPIEVEIEGWDESVIGCMFELE